MIELGLTATGSAAVLYAAFCRLVHTNARTKIRIRLAIWGLAIAAMVALVGPALTDWRPDVVHAWLACTMALHLWVSGRVWRHGVPHSYQRVTP
jgi:hypothetical protein